MSNKPKIVIYGAGEAGKKLYHELTNNDVIAFVDDQAQMNIGSIPVYDLNTFLKTEIATWNYEVILAIPSLDDMEKIVSIYEVFSNKGKKVSFIASNDNLTQLLPLRYQITDDIITKLLGRKNPEILDPEDFSYFSKKTIMVIGAGGSIGCVLSKILSSFDTVKLHCIDTSELNIFNLQREIAPSQCSFHLCDMRDTKYLEYLINKIKPDILINAAAYKHVNILQQDPLGAFKNNIQAFCNLVDISKKSGVDTFIQVSTDKAADPKNIMGATKLFAERYLAALNDVKFTSKIVRFGNVLGSSGSVLPIFADQLYRNQTIKVTHPDVERFFMSIPEAAQLVLKCATLADPGIYILKMGKPKKILDLALKLAALTNIEKPIVEFTKLRSGEKLSEKLVGRNENILEVNDKIYFSPLDPFQNLDNLIEDIGGVRTDKCVIEFLNKHLGCMVE